MQPGPSFVHRCVVLGGLLDPPEAMVFSSLKGNTWAGDRRHFKGVVLDETFVQNGPESPGTCLHQSCCRISVFEVNTGWLSPVLQSDASLLHYHKARLAHVTFYIPFGFLDSHYL